jgi:hypothetical protein
VLKEVMGAVDALAERVYGARRRTEGRTGRKPLGGAKLCAPPWPQA